MTCTPRAGRRSQLAQHTAQVQIGGAGFVTIALSALRSMGLLLLPPGWFPTLAAVCCFDGSSYGGKLAGFWEGPDISDPPEEIIFCSRSTMSTKTSVCKERAAPHQLRLPRAPSNLALSASRDGAPQLLWAAVPAPHRPLGKGFLPNLNLPSFSLKPFLFALSLS